MAEAPTYIACLTPPGRGAIATLAVQGPHAWEMTRALFEGAAPLPAVPEAGRFWFGRLGAELRDEVVLAVARTAPVPRLEVHCHGGPEVVRLLQETYALRGATVAEGPTVGLRADEPAWQRDVLAELVRAPTRRTAAILLDQYQGALAGALTRIVADLDAGRGASAREALAHLERQVPLGEHLVRPWRVVLAGAPNVGKSSLVNALVGFTRSLVAPTPGTTRDVVTTAIALDGWPVELTDTAGLRAVAAGVERAGIVRARAALATADLRLWVLDGTAPPVMPEEDGAAWHVVINKSDLAPTWNRASRPDAIVVSARTRAGLDTLCAAIGQKLVPTPPDPGAAVPCTPTACAAVRAAAERLQHDDATAARERLTAYLGT